MYSCRIVPWEACGIWSAEMAIPARACKRLLILDYQMGGTEVNIQFIKRHFRITQQCFEIVHNDISEGSEPGPRFYILVAVSTLIASFGLLANSTAVVIGAMLVAPLMTPIFGMSLALVRGTPSYWAARFKRKSWVWPPPCRWVSCWGRSSAFSMSHLKCFPVHNPIFLIY